MGLDLRPSALIVGLSLVGGSAVALIGWAYYQAHRPVVMERESPTSSGQVLRRPKDWAAAYSATLHEVNQSVRELQGSLNAARETLDKRAAALHQKNAECQKLQDQLDRSLMLLMTLLEEGDSPPSTGRKESGDARAREQVESDLQLLRQSVTQAESLRREQDEQLMMLQLALVEADTELAEIRERGERQLTLLQDEKRSVEETTSKVVAQCGAAALPLLVALLADERVEVRRWAALALGEMGMAGREALVPLRELLLDPATEVRETAAQAIERLEGRGE